MQVGLIRRPGGEFHGVAPRLHRRAAQGAGVAEGYNDGSTDPRAESSNRTGGHSVRSGARRVMSVDILSAIKEKARSNPALNGGACRASWSLRNKDQRGPAGTGGLA